MNATNNIGILNIQNLQALHCFGYITVNGNCFIMLKELYVCMLTNWSLYTFNEDFKKHISALSLVTHVSTDYVVFWSKFAAKAGGTRFESVFFRYS